MDDAIVVIENIDRFIEADDLPMRAAFKGAKQIGFTVVSMILLLIAVFIPLLFMGGLIGRLFHEFAVTGSLAILVSGVISLTPTPMLCSRFLRAEADSPPPGRFSRGCEHSYQWQLGHYETGLKWVLRHTLVFDADQKWASNHGPRGTLGAPDGNNRSFSDGHAEWIGEKRFLRSAGNDYPNPLWVYPWSWTWTWVE